MSVKNLSIVLFLLIFASLSAFAQEDTPPFEGENLILATTTSTYDSGLLDYLLPFFTQQTGASVDVIAVGTGQALEIGRNGDADVVLVHARASEDAFVCEGYAQARYDVMYNDFIIVGDATDPANIGGMTDATAALALIAESEATFVSRGDDSGTHSKEKSLWAAAEITPEGGWYNSAGQGMGAVLTLTEELQGYTLTDRATYIARQAEGLTLEILVEGDTLLFNPYGVMAVNPELHPTVKAELAQAFVDWLIAPETQVLIGEFTLEGQTLFFPSSAPYLEAQLAAAIEAGDATPAPEDAEPAEVVDPCAAD